MRKFSFLLFVLLFISAPVFSQLPELPSAATNYNVQSLPVGSFVIAMDNANQAEGAGVPVFNTVIADVQFDWTIGDMVLRADDPTTGILVGMEVVGHGNIPTGALVTAVTGTTVTIDIAPTGTQDNKRLDFGYSAFSAAGFNLNAYGLLVRLLNYDKRLKWVIKPAKMKDDIDFSVMANRMSTTANTNTVSLNRDFTITAGSNIGTISDATNIVPGMKVSGDGNIPPNAHIRAISGTTITLSNEAIGDLTNKSLNFAITNIVSFNATLDAAALYDFRAGPFVIFASDTTGVTEQVAGFNEINGTTVRVYKTTAPVDVDVRFDYLINGAIWKPRAAILDDGGKADIHIKYMTNASISAANVFTNWTREIATGFIKECYTFGSEPHNDGAPDSVIQGIRAFVEKGGNFLAQCAAARKYEDSPFGRFHSTLGFQAENSEPAVDVYSNAYLPYMQINGELSIHDVGGSLWSWLYPPTPINNFHTYISGDDGGQIFTNTSVAKLLPAGQLGGIVSYLGSHNYDGNNNYNINGQRMYLNAFITPTNPQGSLVTTKNFQCTDGITETRVTVGSSTGPLSAYPLKFLYFRDLAPKGFGPEDTRLDSTTFASQGLSDRTLLSGDLGRPFNYGLKIIPRGTCLQSVEFYDTCFSVLPINLLSFNAIRNVAIVNLKWETSTELNNKGFEIQRLLGSGVWETIAFVKSLALNGSSNTKLTYSYTDPNNYRGISQYKLRQIDVDNRVLYSEIRSVKGEFDIRSVIVYPNPSNGPVHVNFEDSFGTLNISLHDMSGRILSQWKGLTRNTLKISDLESGMYILRIIVQETNEQLYKKVIVNRQ